MKPIQTDTLCAEVNEAVLNVAKKHGWALGATTMRNSFFRWLVAWVRPAPGARGQISRNYSEREELTTVSLSSFIEMLTRGPPVNEIICKIDEEEVYKTADGIRVGGLRVSSDTVEKIYKALFPHSPATGQQVAERENRGTDSN